MTKPEEYVKSGEVVRAEEKEIDSMPEDERETERIQKIRSMYDSGIPFFRKENIKNIHQQLLRVKEKGERIWVVGLDGVKVDFETQTGSINPGLEPENEFVLTEPFIAYRSFQALASRKHRYGGSDYCTTPIFHRMKERNTATKEGTADSIRPARPWGEVAEFFETNRQAWETSPQCKQLRSILASANTPVEINKIVAFACGKFTFKPTSIIITHIVERSASQHALILTLRDVLSEKNGNLGGIACYAQDPGYSDTDKSILEKYGIKILSDPEGFLEVDDATVVLSFSPNVPVRQVVADLARPAVMIWNRIMVEEAENEEEGAAMTDPDSPRLKEMAQKVYDELEMPGDGSHDPGNTSRFGRVAVYVRRTNVAAATKA